MNTARPMRAIPPAWLLLALGGGLVLGLMSTASSNAVVVARLLGGGWLDCLRATIIPLVFALVTTGVAGLARGIPGGTGGHVGGRVLVTFAGFLLMSVVITYLVVPLMLNAFPLARGSISHLGITPSPSAVSSGLGEALRAMIPVNIIAAAAGGAIVQVVIFAVVLGIALGRVSAAPSAALLEPLQGLAEAMIVVVRWILLVAPIGVFALAFVIGATLGMSAFHLLGEYIALQALVASLIALLACLAPWVLGKVRPGRFLRAVAPAQAIAASTQSSIASLPAMLESARKLGVAEQDAAVALPLAVALFKATAPASSLIVALSLANIAGVPLEFTRLLFAVPIALVATFAVLGMPGSVSFLAANTPAAIALGAPIELIPLLLAVDTIPDMFRTTANVTAQVATTIIIARPRPKPNEPEARDV